MEANALNSNDFEAVATAVYQAIEDSPLQQSMDLESNPDLDHEADGNGDDAYEEDDMDNATDSISDMLSHDGSATQYGRHSALEKDTCPQAANASMLAHDGASSESTRHSQSFHYGRHEEDTDLQHGELKAIRKSASDYSKKTSMILHNEAGLIKKIKLSKADNVSAKGSKTKGSNNLATASGASSTEEKSSNAQRSNYSREYLALQRSVNESKILTEFVTDISADKTRKLRAKDTSQQKTPAASDHSYSSSRRNTNGHLGNMDKLAAQAITIIGSSLPAAAKRHNKRCMTTKEDNISRNCLRSRSRSVHHYDSDHSTSSTNSAPKRWPYSESSNSFKRANMRSENSEFVQKQKDFLQQVINSTQETPNLRSRSQSMVLELAEGNSNSSTRQRSKDRTCKRVNSDVELEEDDNSLTRRDNVADSSSLTEPTDENSIYDSTTSVNGLNSSGEMYGENSTDNLLLSLHKAWKPPPKAGYDSFCWKCHLSDVHMGCSKCIRSFHSSCAKVKTPDNGWVCPDCVAIDNVLNNKKGSRRHEPPLDLLSQLLAFALKRMRFAKGHYAFVMPYEEVAAYKNFIINPMTFDALQVKIAAKEYRCTEEFISDTKWMLHNAYILGLGNSTKNVSITKTILKTCRQEATEIETCAECYLNANTRTDWFVDVCSQPHLLLWAKLKGFPYWPAKAMGFGQHSWVNVKFFGEHDRAFVPVKECYLYSEQDPNPQTGKRAARELADCIKEVEEHIERIKSKVGGFKYAPYKTPYDPSMEMKQLEDMMPGVHEFIKRQQGLISKPSLQFKIYKTADNNLSIVQKDASTPELPAMSQQLMAIENEESQSSVKKKKLNSPAPNELDDKKLETIPHSAAKYEVITKVSAEDNKSSKLSPVILKRKASGCTEGKKMSEDEGGEAASGVSKMPRFEDMSAEHKANNSMEEMDKYNTETNCNERVAKVKHHAKSEPKIPPIAIKTTASSKAVISLAVTEKAMDKVAAVVGPAAPAITPDAAASRQVMEMLTKNKPGVTIKKIPRDHPSPASTPPIAASMPAATKPSLIASSDCNVSPSPGNDVGQATSKSATEQTLESGQEKKKVNDQKVNNLLKGLVPFVEIKQEVLSDNEEVDTAQAASAESVPAMESAAVPSTCQTSCSTTSLPSSQVSEEVKTSSLAPLNIAPLQIKEEVFSDEEQQKEEAENSSNHNKSKAQTLTAEPQQMSDNAKVQGTVNNSQDVRVVGETIIQKLSNKNSNQAQGTGATGCNKRNSLKGIPYGPLPASAMPKNCQIPAQTECPSPKAKKMTPSRPISPMEKPKPLAMAANNVAAANARAVESPNLRTTMVAIPVDVAASRNSSNSMGTSIPNIPVAPLTAVSKTSSQSSQSCTALALNCSTPSAAGIPAAISTSPIASVSAAIVTAISSSNFVSATMAACTTAAAAATQHSPITVVTSSSKYMAPLTTSTPISNSNSINTNSNLNINANPNINAVSSIPNAKKRLANSTPPPLAGLSRPTVSSAIMANGIVAPAESVSTPQIPAVATMCVSSQTEANNDTQLLSGLLTPTLSTAIRDAMGRGPPQLISRPKGPLDSDGYAMRSMQAGPVGKRLVDNAHKITDYFISVMEDTIGEIAQGGEGSLHAKVLLLEKELERTKQFYEQQIADIKKTTELMRISMENEKNRLVNEVSKQCEAQRLRSIEETKRKQWCAQCSREANFYCCWNTSYCDYPCQQLHWSRHVNNCAQTRATVPESNSSSTTSSNSNSANVANMQHMHSRVNSPEDRRHHSTKSNNANSSASSSSTNITTNYNTKSSNANNMGYAKKEKLMTTKNSANNSMISGGSVTHLAAAPPSVSVPSAVATAVAAAASRTNNAPSAEVLKLPTNTYLRPVSGPAMNNPTLRCNTAYSIPMQRFNVPSEQPAEAGEQMDRRLLRDAANVLEMPNKQFHDNFRVSKEIFQMLLKKLEHKWLPSYRSTHIRADIKLATFLNFLATGSFQHAVGNEYISFTAKSSVCRIIGECLQLFEDWICAEWIKMPGPEEQTAIKKAFQNEIGFPGIIGCVGVTHIRIKSPGEESKHYYMNKKKSYYSINTMIICDNQMRINYVNACHPGSDGDALIWQRSEEQQNLLDSLLNEHMDRWILGNRNFKLKPYLMTPIRHAQLPCERTYNAKHQLAYSIIHRCLLGLKQRFHCLTSSRGLHYTPAKAAKIINACCALHNMCIDYKCTEVEVFPPPGIELEKELLNIDDSDVEEVDEHWSEIAVTIRQQLAMHLASDLRQSVIEKCDNDKLPTTSHGNANSFSIVRHSGAAWPPQVPMVKTPPTSTVAAPIAIVPQIRNQSSVSAGAGGSMMQTSSTQSHGKGKQMRYH